MISLHEPSLDGNEWKYVKECVDTNWVSSAGAYVEQFEEKIAEYTLAKNAVACANGTSALQVSVRLAGVLPGDEVLVPTISFIAPINAIHYNGAIPVFMDADDHYNIDADKTIEFIRNETELAPGGSPRTINVKTGRRVSAIVPVHVWGDAVWMDELVALCEERNFAVVEDACESLGTWYCDGSFSQKHTGTIGRLGCLSFNGNKIITTGGGGMILTDDDELAERARHLTTQAKDDSVHYIHDEVGYNFRLSNIQAALGVAQLEQLPGFLKRKRDIHETYVEGVRDIPGLTIAPGPGYAGSNHWLNVLRVDPDVYGRSRSGLMVDLEKQGIQTRPVWHPNHLQKPYKDCQAYKIVNAARLVENSLCLPSGGGLNDEDIAKVTMLLRSR